MGSGERRQGDKEKGRQGDKEFPSPCPLVPLSPCLLSPLPTPALYDSILLDIRRRVTVIVFHRRSGDRRRPYLAEVFRRRGFHLSACEIRLPGLCVGVGGARTR